MKHLRDQEVEQELGREGGRRLKLFLSSVVLLVNFSQMVPIGSSDGTLLWLQGEHAVMPRGTLE